MWSGSTTINASTKKVPIIHLLLVLFHLRETVINASMLTNDGDAEFEKSPPLRQLPVKSIADLGGAAARWRATSPVPILLDLHFWAKGHRGSAPCMTK